MKNIKIEKLIFFILLVFIIAEIIFIYSENYHYKKHIERRKCLATYACKKDVDNMMNCNYVDELGNEETIKCPSEMIKYE